MKGILLSGCLSLFAGSCLNPPPTEPTPPPGSCAAPPPAGLVRVAGAIKDRYIVVLKKTPGVHSLLMQPTAQAKARALQSRFRGVTIRDTYSETISGFSAMIAPASVAAITSDPEVQYVQQEGVKGVRQAPASWGLDRIDQRLGLDQTYAPGADGTGVVVAVIDTGISPHPDFASRLALEFFTAHGSDARDGHGHGTHVAGTVAGTRFGVARAATLLAVKVLDDSGSGSDSDVIRGIEWVTAWKQSHPGVDVVGNMSLGGSPAPAIDDATCDSMAAGVTYAIAAGNEDLPASTSSPARVEDAITVCATTITDRRASFSNWGPLIDLCAPGEDIVSATPSGGSTSMSGTSMASPHVAGAAALYLQRHPGASPQQVRDGLVAAATTGALSDLKGSADRLLFTKED